ncbi:tryptophan halogenase family protein [Glaciecola sp. 2405UD65-10]|uniref:tryptophan halogenase family protein n=1 Tax=Glaciecola sp. 2405UD65-10 TaxID=3397244 RepID=UPI003B5C6913
MSSKRNRIVIAGGGTAGWMAANLFAKQLSDFPVDISLVESPEIGIIGVGEGSTPNLKHFFDILGVKESEWMARCNATYKLSIQFAGWSPSSNVPAYSHPFSSQVDLHTYRAFNMNCLTRRMGLDTTTQPDLFFLNAVLSKQLRSVHASENFPFDIQYGYHFDSYLLGSYLRDVGKDLGVKHILDKITSAETLPSGEIASLVLEKGGVLEGDFFIDCTGFASLLIGKTLNTPFESFSENLFNDSAVVFPTPALKPLPLETKATALSAGWAWQIPLQNRTGNGYVYSSKYLSPELAEKELREHLGIDDSQEARHLKMRVGQMSKHWVKNCLAVGLSQGFIEPLEATALHLVQVSCELFVDHYTKGNLSNEFQDEFNKTIHYRFERVRDYIVAHYKLNTRNDSQYWIDNRANENLSDSLVQILQAWFNKKDMLKEINRQQLAYHFDANSWNAMLAGYGTFPPLAAKQAKQGDLYLENNIEHFLNKCALNFAKTH